MRNETNRLVSSTDLVDLDCVRSLLKTISYRRRFLAHLEKKRVEKYEKDMLFLLSSVSLKSCHDIPFIVVENMPEMPPMSSRDIASAGLESSPCLSNSRYRDPDYTRSMSMDLASGSRLQRSDYSTFSKMEGVEQLNQCCKTTAGNQDVLVVWTFPRTFI